MANQLWSQTLFTKGELSPYMYARSDHIAYYNGLKTAQNAIGYPQGPIGKRFGTVYNALLSNVTSADSIFFQTFQYLNECVYQVLFRPSNIDIYLEGILVATVGSTTLDAVSVYNLDYTVLDSTFRVSGEAFKPKDLTRAANAANVILSVATNTFTMTTAIVAGLVLPVRFTNVGGVLPVTVPQVKAGVTYFVKNVTTATMKVYANAVDAKAGVNAFTLSTIGTGTNNIITQNAWTFANAAYRNLPIYDFTGGYDTYTFTPSAASGAAVTLTSSTAIFTDAYIGGAYVGGGGVARITAVGSASPITTCTIAIEQPFDSGAAISGRLSLLAEPAWSDARGWPQKCSSYQNRAVFANSASLPNGFWASAINDYNDFNDMQADDDDAISWYPTSDEVNFIRFIVPYRSITVHTNSGVYSSPLSDTNAITPRNFCLLLQDSTPAEHLQPRAIDNQIIIVSGNDVHTLLWDGLNNAYSSNIVSLTNEQVIRTPVDEAPYTDLIRAGSRYVFIINDNGSMAIFQTVLSEDIAGWTPHITEQSYGDAKFLQVASSFTGRAWFVTQREIAEAIAAVNITAFTSTTLTAVATSFSTTEATAVKFATTGSLPVSSPQIAVSTYYWVIGVTADTFKVYPTQEDALEDENGITFTSAGTTSTVEPWPLTTKFYMEELSNDARLDCAEYFDGSASSTITGLTRFNAQDVKMVGDGFGFECQVIGGVATFEAHGEAVQVSEGYIGFPIYTILEPLPLSMANGPTIKSTSLTEPKHVRFIKFMFNNTIGGTINGVPIALNNFDQADIGEPPTPARGFVEMSVMKGWDDFNQASYTIEHSDPFNIELLGVFYVVDV